MQRTVFVGELLGEFWVPGSEQRVGGRLTLRHGQRPELTVIGSLENRAQRDLFGRRASRFFRSVQGNVLVPGRNNQFKSVTLVGVENSDMSTGLLSGAEMSNWRVSCALLGSQPLDLDEVSFNTIDVCLQGFPSSYGPSLDEVFHRDEGPQSRTDIFGSVAGVELSAYVWVGHDSSSFRSNHRWWEAAFRLTLDEPETLQGCLSRIPAVISGYSMLSGRYTPVHWIRLANHTDESVLSDYDLYGNFGESWTTVDRLPNEHQDVNSTEDREFFLNWLELCQSDAGKSLGEELSDALQAEYTASQGQKIAWRLELVRLAGLTEAAWKLRKNKESAWPAKRLFGRTWKRLKPLIEQAIDEAELELPYSSTVFVDQLRRIWDMAAGDSLAHNLRALAQEVHADALFEARTGSAQMQDDEIQHWVRMRNHVAHQGQSPPSVREALQAVRKWRALLNAWILMHLGAHADTVRVIVDRAKLRDPSSI